MSPDDRKRLLVALCACDRVELSLQRVRPQEPNLPFIGAFKRAIPWLGLLSRFMPRRSSGSSRGASFMGPLFQLALGFLNRSR